MSAAYARSIAGLGHGAPPARGRRAPRRVAAVAEAGPTPEAVEAAYTACEASTRASSATFHFATLLMRPTQRRSVQAIYAWCRELDETVDGVEALKAPREEADRKLSAIEADLRAMFDDDDRGGGPVVAPSSAPETIALADTIRRTPGLEAGPFLDMIAGMRSDLAVTLDVNTGLPSKMFDDWPALRAYCYRVAGTVGLMTLPVMGTARGYTVEQASTPGIELGIALQLTNILRDVGEDARRGAAVPAFRRDRETRFDTARDPRRRPGRAVRSSDRERDSQGGGALCTRGGRGSDVGAGGAASRARRRRGLRRAAPKGERQRVR